jgi:N-acetyl-anhydromuramyl-L-alanine amidase AmpD
MSRRLVALFLLASVALLAHSAGVSAGATAGRPAIVAAQAKQPQTSIAPLTTVDYRYATWVAAASSNYTVADRNHDYPVDMIVIHDIEGSASSAIKAFQDPSRHGSAHYVISYAGHVWQMVLEKDVAWHAGNWDYNTRAIGIEHEGYAWTPGLYTAAEYIASAKVAASICSRWGVPLDRAHVIGHNQVPDPFHRGLYGGAEHHTDPGPYWNWSYYLGIAQTYAAALPSPPHLGPDPLAVPADQSATVSWQPAHSCHEPVDGYTVTAQPGNIVQTLPPTATSATFNGLQNGLTYTFTVTTQNSYGQDTLQSNSVIVSPPCANPTLTTTTSSPQPAGIKVQLASTSTACTNPMYEFWLQDPSGAWSVQRGFGKGTWIWDTRGFRAGDYTVHVWANQETGSYAVWQSYAELKFTILEPPRCASANLSPASASVPAGSVVKFVATSTACITPLYAFWLLKPTGVWTLEQRLSTLNTWSLNTAGLAPGNYTVHVWANQEGHSTTAWETYASSTVSVTVCASASISPPSASQAAGGVVAFTAGSSGCVNPNYEFWVQYPDGTWNLRQRWGGSAFNWATTGLAPGRYTVHAWANQVGDSISTWEAYATSTVTLTGCSAAMLSPSSGSAMQGSPVNFTGSSVGCPAPVYAFWLRYPNGVWQLMRPFGVDAWSWSTATFPKGSYVIHVWANSGGSSGKTWQAYGSADFSLT